MRRRGIESRTVFDIRLPLGFEPPRANGIASFEAFSGIPKYTWAAMSTARVQPRRDSVAIREPTYLVSVVVPLRFLSDEE